MSERIAAAISALAPRLQSSPPVAWKGLLVAGPVAPVLPAFVPQAAVPRYAERVGGRELQNRDRGPCGTSAGFARKTFAAMVPGSAERSLQPVVPEPQPVAAGRMALPDAALTISGVGLPSLARELALDVYVQRCASPPGAKVPGASGRSKSFLRPPFRASCRHVSNNSFYRIGGGDIRPGSLLFPRLRSARALTSSRSRSVFRRSPASNRTRLTSLRPSQPPWSLAPRSGWARRATV